MKTKISLIKDLKKIKTKGDKLKQDKSNLVKGLAMIIASIDYLDEKI